MLMLLEALKFSCMAAALAVLVLVLASFLRKEEG